MFSLAGKVALVTGGGRGIGRGIVRALAEQGADVAIGYRADPKDATAAANDIEALGRKAFPVGGDVSKAVDACGLVAQTVERLGRLDILVNNAGVLSFAPFLDMEEKTWEHVIRVNLTGQFLVAQAAARHMVKTGTGRIINIASIASGGTGVGFPGIAHYAASKGGVIAMTETMALELGSKGITVNAIAPGVIQSDMTKDMLADPGQVQGMLTRVPAGRVGQPRDIGAAVAFLASDEASYCAGATLYVDGGWLAG